MQNHKILIKCFIYPINESTWEAKSNIKHLSEILDKFEAQYSYYIAQNMYNIFVLMSKRLKKEVKELEKERKKFQMELNIYLNQEKSKGFLKLN